MANITRGLLTKGDLLTVGPINLLTYIHQSKICLESRISILHPKIHV